MDKFISMSFFILLVGVAVLADAAMGTLINAQTITGAFLVGVAWSMKK